MKYKKTALVTGASSGIGKQIALDLAKNGFKICINYSKSKQKAELVKKEIEQMGASAFIYCADISNEKEVQKMFEVLSKEFGTLDVLVNNAGIYIPDFIEDYSIDNFDQTLNINLKGKVLCTKYAIPLLKSSSSPRIINIASRAAVIAMEESLAYCCAASSIIMLTKISAIELAKYNIKVNAISPGLTRTPMTEEVDEEEEFQDYASKNPSKRVGTVEDISNTVQFLVSEKSEFINGENINVSGGIILI